MPFAILIFNASNVFQYSKKFSIYFQYSQIFDIIFNIISYFDIISMLFRYYFDIISLLFRYYFRCQFLNNFTFIFLIQSFLIMKYNISRYIPNQISPLKLSNPPLIHISLRILPQTSIKLLQKSILVLNLYHSRKIDIILNYIFRTISQTII